MNPTSSKPISPARPSRRRSENRTHHLAILRTPYLKKILTGEKRIECRFQRRAFPPFGHVHPGDVLWLKESCGPVVAKATVELVLSFETLTPETLTQIHRDYNADILGDPDYWRSVQDCIVGTLIWLKNVAPLEPFRIRKTDRRGWVPLDAPLRPNQLIGQA